jgi:uncharacterized OsmC-like protein/alpha-beta hydrolase superfamily lysophospholipase
MSHDSASQSVSHAVRFPGGAGRELVGRLDLPADGQLRACAVFAHCFTCGKNLRGAVELTRALTLEGFAVLRFDFTGLGESEGEFAETTFSSTADDIVAAAEFMAREHEAPRLLVGHSLGGTAVIRAAERIPSARAVVTIGSPFDAAHVTHLFTDHLRTIEDEGDAEVSIAGSTFTVSSDFLQDVREVRIDSCLANLGQALLVMHAPADRIVGIDNAARIYTAAKHPKSFISLDSADHLLSDRGDALYAARTLAAWASRYLPGEEEPTVEELIAREDVAVRTGPEGFRSEIRSGRHGLVADEPVAVGGGDAGPSPYDLLLSALGACTGMTLRMYADRKGWPLEEISVHLRHSRIHALDDSHPEEGDARMDLLNREIELQGDLDADQRTRLLEIAERCPVHRTLEAGVHIETEAAVDVG